MSKSKHSTKDSRKHRVLREQHQIKISRKEKSIRGVPEYYDELKKQTTFGITSTAKQGINSLSKARSISMSELIERIGRGIIKLAEIEEVPHI